MRPFFFLLITSLFGFGLSLGLFLGSQWERRRQRRCSSDPSAHPEPPPQSQDSQ